MRHYPFHVGDYRSATSHLSDSEDLTYRRLIDHYYDTEQPISTDLPMVARRLRVSQTDLVTVLQDFFTESEGAWHHARCDAELEKYHSYKESGKKGAEKRWGNDRGPIGGLPDPNATPIATKNQEPRTSNQEPSKPKDTGNVTVAVLLADGCSEAYANELLSLRKKKRAPLTPIAWNGIKNEIKKAGMALDDGIGIMAAKGWQSFEAAWLTQSKTQLSTIVPAPIRTCVVCRSEATKQIGSYWYCQHHDQYSEAA